MKFVVSCMAVEVAAKIRIFRCGASEAARPIGRKDIGILHLGDMQQHSNIYLLRSIIIF